MRAFYVREYSFSNELALRLLERVYSKARVTLFPRGLPVPITAWGISEEGTPAAYGKITKPRNSNRETEENDEIEAEK